VNLASVTLIDLVRSRLPELISIRPSSIAV
jgi:hypothetical protein